MPKAQQAHSKKAVDDCTFAEAMTVQQNGEKVARRHLLGF